MLNPVLRWTTSQELRRIAEDLEAAQSGLGTLPTGRGEFDLWLTDRYREESARVDAWGTRYTLLVRNDSFYVSSAGPDGRFGTEDDLAQGRGMAPRARAR
jgi:hypothetical protein